MKSPQEINASRTVNRLSDHAIVQQPLGLDLETIQEREPSNLEILFALDEVRPANNVVLNCQDNLEFLREQPNEKFKLIVTSPPYNIGKSYEVQSSLEDYLTKQRQVLGECIRVLHP